jgi:hypothetical protein
MSRFSCTSYKPGSCQRRHVSGLVGHIVDNEEDVDYRLGCQAGHGRRSDVLDGGFATQSSPCPRGDLHESAWPSLVIIHDHDRLARIGSSDQFQVGWQCRVIGASARSRSFLLEEIEIDAKAAGWIEAHYIVMECDGFCAQFVTAQ